MTLQAALILFLLIYASLWVSSEIRKNRKPKA
jgi:hypothetical protein